MSNSALRAVRDLEEEITGTQHHVLMVLADMAGDDLKAWPSQVTLARICHLCRESVRQAIEGLKSSGLITVEGKKGAALVYRLADRLAQPLGRLEDQTCLATRQVDSKHAQQLDRLDDANMPSRLADMPRFLASHAQQLGTEASGSISKPKKRARARPRKAPPHKPPEAEAILDAFCKATGTKTRQWPESCSKAFAKFRGTEFEITPERVVLVAAHKATWMTDVALSSILRVSGNMPWDSSLEQAERWAEVGRPQKRRNGAVTNEQPTPFKD